MSFVSDVLGFEKFNLGDIWKKIKADPIRAPLGALDPFSTRTWNTVLGKDWEPAVDQFGGAYGGKAITTGDTGEGVYGRAQAAGVPTKAGSEMHDLAHLVTSLFGGNYAYGKLSPLFSNAPSWLQSGYQNFMTMPGGGGQQQPQQNDLLMRQMIQQVMSEMQRRRMQNQSAGTMDYTPPDYLGQGNLPYAT